jgi:hypothetical protein
MKTSKRGTSKVLYFLADRCFCDKKIVLGSKIIIIKQALLTAGMMGAVNRIINRGGLYIK